MPLSLETKHLRLMHALAEEGGPTRAAARLHLTQSAVSHQLAELEEKLGVALFSRERRRLLLTPAGHRLLAFSRTTLGELARVERELHETAARTRVRLRLATECFTCYHWLPQVLPELRRDAPHVDVQIVVAATRAPLAALRKGELDLAIASTPVARGSSGSGSGRGSGSSSRGTAGLVVERLFEDEWVVVMPPGHPLAARPYVRAADLAGHTLFSHDGSPRDVARLRGRLAAERAAMPDVQIVPLTEAILELVKADLGISLLSRWAVAPHAASGQVVVRRFTRAGLKERWSAVYRRDAAAHLPLARFAELLRTRVATGRPATASVTEPGAPRRSRTARGAL